MEPRKPCETDLGRSLEKWRKILGKPSVARKKRQLLTQLAIEHNVTPVDIMARAAAIHYADAQEAGTREEMLERLALAATLAKDVAPYTQPKLNATQVSGDKDNPLVIAMSKEEADKIVATAALGSFKED